MGITSLVFGIISIVISLIPILGTIAILPAIIGFFSGIISLIINRKNKGKSVPITGIVLSVMSVGIMTLWIFLSAKAYTTGLLQEKLKDLTDDIQLEIEQEGDLKSF